MKNQFDSLLKALKQKLRSCEISIAQINQEIAHKQQEIRDFSILLSQVEIPSNGNVLLFRESYETKKAYLGMMDACQNEISILKHQKREKQEEHKKQCLELEKIQYLWNKEMQEKLKFLKAKEQKEMDEIAVMRSRKHQEGEK